MITSRTYRVYVGAYELVSPDLAFTTIYGVKRDGLGQTEVGSSAGNREFVYDSTGKIIFDSTNPFSEPSNEGIIIDDMSAERIWVLFNE